MKSAPKHPNEDQRIQSLESLNILDTLPETDFDDITMIASHVCGTPIALISLIDKERQWFKSKLGIEETETHRDLAFCAHAILQNDVFIVEDSREDERFHDNPLVTGDLNVRFYAGVPLKSPDGYPIGTVCVIDSKPRQLTAAQRKTLEALSNQVTKLLSLRVSLEKLKRTKNTLRNVLDGVPALIGYWGKDLRNIEANESYRAYFGLTPEQVLGMHIKDVLGQALYEKDAPHINAVLEGKSQTFETDMKHTDGTMRQVMVSYIPSRFEGKIDGFFVVATDISDLRNAELQRRTLEARLAQSAKLSTLGEMAGGIAHEVNNPLAIIRISTELLQEALEEGQLTLGTCQQVITTIHDTVDRIAKITGGLRTYARDAGEDPFEKCSAKTILEDTILFCNERLQKNHIPLTIQCEASIALECRPTQVSQVALSLINNSIDAVSELSEKWIRIKVEEDSRDVIFTFVDSGAGIPPKTADKMMQPFFTTKPVGQGTGLGLCTALGIASVHSGDLKYDPKAKNTTFVLTLPKIHLANTPEPKK